MVCVCGVGDQRIVYRHVWAKRGEVECVWVCVCVCVCVCVWVGAGVCCDVCVWVGGWVCALYQACAH